MRRVLHEGQTPRPLQEEGGQKVEPAVDATGPGKAVREEATVQVLPEIVLDVCWHRVFATVAGVGYFQPGLQMLLHNLINHGPLGPARLVNHRASGRLGRIEGTGSNGRHGFRERPWVPGRSADGGHFRLASPFCDGSHEILARVLVSAAQRDRYGA